MLRSLLPFALGAMLASPALALEPGGTLTGTVGEWQVEAEIWGGQSDYDDYGTGGKGGSVSLMTKSDLSSEAGLGTTAIGIEAFTFASGPFDDVQIRILTKTDPVEAYSADLDNEIVWTIDEAVLEGDFLKISGTLEGTLMRGGLYSLDRDPSKTLPMKLRFDAVVPRVE